MDAAPVEDFATRLLRRFERSGWLRLGRERIDVLDPAALRHVALANPAPSAREA